MKLSVASQMSERIIVLADSDLVFIRPVTSPPSLRMDAHVCIGSTKESDTRSLVICAGTPSRMTCSGYRPPRLLRCPTT